MVLKVQFQLQKLRLLCIQHQQRVFYLSKFNHNGKELYLMLDGVISPVGTVTKTSASFLILLSLLLLPIAVILAHSLSKKIAHPITQISKQAKGLSSGNYTEVTSSTREISELNSTLTQAARDLKQVDPSGKSSGRRRFFN